MSIVHIFEVFSFSLGACIASFLNVVIWRVPRGESIVSPPSHCPSCNSKIKWWQNIPLISWLMLRGRCASCKCRISPRYFIVELIGGVLFLAAFWKYFSPDPIMLIWLLVMWIWIALMIVGSFIDFDHKLLPDFVTVGGMVLGVVTGGVLGLMTKSWYPIGLSLSGLALGFGLFWLLRVIGTKAFKREAMGMGDVFLMGAIGAIFGPAAVFITLIISSVVGSVVGVSMILISRTRFGKFVEIPFGPYICLGCIVWMFYGWEILNWYLGKF